MNIIIFENEFYSIENTFKYLNSTVFKGKLSVTDYPQSQSIDNLELLRNYDLIIIDLDLSTKSTHDGYGLIREIEKKIPNDTPPILILTGQDVPENFVQIHGLKKEYDFLKKPINFRKLEKAIKKATS